MWLVQERRLFLAAKYLEVPAWELAQQPVFWMERALFHRGLDIELSEVKVNTHAN